jgi:hypothetical protein
MSKWTEEPVEMVTSHMQPGLMRVRFANAPFLEIAIDDISEPGWWEQAMARAVARENARRIDANVPVIEEES